MPLVETFPRKADPDSNEEAPFGHRDSLSRGLPGIRVSRSFSDRLARPLKRVH